MEVHRQGSGGGMGALRRSSRKCLATQHLNEDSKVVWLACFAIGSPVLLWGHSGGALVAARGSDLKPLRQRYFWCSFCILQSAFYILRCPPRRLQEEGRVPTLLKGVAADEMLLGRTETREPEAGLGLGLRRGCSGTLALTRICLQLKTFQILMNPLITPVPACPARRARRWRGRRGYRASAGRGRRCGGRNRCSTPPHYSRW